MKLTALQRPQTHEQNVKVDWKPRKKPVVLATQRSFLLDFPFHRRGRGTCSARPSRVSSPLTSAEQRRQPDFCQADFCPGMTRKETEVYLVTLRPKPVFEPSIRKRPSGRQPAAPPQQPKKDKLTPKAPEPRLEQTPPKSSPPILQPAKS